MKDVKAAIFDMSSHKAPGIDGFPASFFQKGWESMRMDVLNFVTKVFVEGYLPKEVANSLVHYSQGSAFKEIVTILPDQLVYGSSQISDQGYCEQVEIHSS